MVAASPDPVAMRARGKAAWLFGCVVAASAVAACAAAPTELASDDADLTESAAPTEAFDVSDVSVLFPFEGSTPYPAIRAMSAATSAHESLVTERVFDDLVAEARKQGIEGDGGQLPGTATRTNVFSDRDAWHVVGFRFDPCAPGFSQAARDANPDAETKGKCLIQLRLVAQPFTVISREVMAGDFTMHLVYTLGASDLESLPTNPIVVEASRLLGGIKKATVSAGATTAGQPLGVHAGLAAEVNSGGHEIADLVKIVIDTFTASSTRSVAFMGPRGSGREPWTFFAGNVVDDRFVSLPGPAHGGASQTFGLTTIVPKSRLPVSTAPLFEPDAKNNPASRTLPFKVDDPGSQHFFNTDCASCHTSSSIIRNLSLGDGAEIAERVKVPKNITGYVADFHALANVWSVRSFGYFFRNPSVSGRTVAETVEVVQWFNTKVRATGGVNGSGPDCSAVDDDVWKCFRDGRKNCLDACSK